MQYNDFRLFYNQSIHPELLHLELQRRRLIRLMFVSVLLLLGVVALQLYIGIFVFTLALLIPVGLWIAYLVFKIQTYFKAFKPRIVALLLDFVDNHINFFFEKYDNEGKIAKKDFLESRIFTTADDYAGEDLIVGKVRETPFKMSELRVKEFSPARNQLNYVFRGVFLIADFQRWDMQGKALMLPDAYRKYLSRSERAFHLEGGRRVRNHLLPEFEAFFDTYATPDLRLQDVISTDMQRSILNFRNRFQQQNREKEIYVSVIGDKIYLGLTQDRDLLEPNLFVSNVNFESILEFYDDLSMLLNIVLDIDVMN